MHVYDATEAAYKNGYEAGYAAGKRDAVKKGQWTADGQCPFCGEYDNRDPFGSNFCHNCGADMRKDKAIL